MGKLDFRILRKTAEVMQGTFTQILDLAGLRHFNFHALRHTFATRAMELGIGEKTLSTLLGHYSISFTMDAYAHVLDTHKWEGINLMPGRSAASEIPLDGKCRLLSGKH